MPTQADTTDNFFNSLNTVKGVEDEDYKLAQLVINTIKAVNRNSNEGIYVIDYFRRNFLYASENMSFWCGCSPQEVLKKGYNIYLENVPESEQPMLLEINKAGFTFFDGIPNDERYNYTISYDFHLSDGKTSRLINHHLTPIWNKNGKIWLALCTFTQSSAQSAGNVLIKNDKDDSFLMEYSLETSTWTQKAETNLNEIEKEILLLASRGFTEIAMADHLFRSIDTIKFYKKRIFKKLNVKSTAEAIVYASNRKLI